MALAVSCNNGLPVRVVRGARGDPDHSPDHGFRYDGLFTVTRYGSKPGLDGFLVWQFELCQFSDSVNQVPVLPAPLPRTDRESGPAPRARETTWRLIRNTAVGAAVNALHGYVCQICGIRIETLTGPYAEAAHVRPLGRSHNGPDTESNVLCLCPNCHIQFDRLALYIEKDGAICRTRSGEKIGVLRSVSAHYVDPEQLAYQKALCRPDED